MPAYSFLDVAATITGPGGSFQLAAHAGAAEEGISWAMVDDKNTMQIGAGGEGQHSLHASKAGTITVRLLKTSPVNAQLSAMYDLQEAASGVWGANIIRISRLSVSGSGDVATGRACAFKKRPDWSYAKDAGTVEWAFDSIYIDAVIGTY